MSRPIFAFAANVLLMSLMKVPEALWFAISGFYLHITVANIFLIADDDDIVIYIFALCLVSETKQIFSYTYGDGAGGRPVVLPF